MKDKMMTNEMMPFQLAFEPKRAEFFLEAGGRPDGSIDLILNFVSVQGKKVCCGELHFPSLEACCSWIKRSTGDDGLFEQP